MEKQAEQAVEPTVSVEDRIGSIFGGDDPPEQEQPEETKPEGEESEETSEESAEEAEPEGSEFVEAEFNGVKYQVPPELKDALMATQDYTKKTTELAQVRRAVELQQKEAALFQQTRAFEESVASDLDNLKMLGAYIKHVEDNTEWAKLTTDQIVRARMELDQYSRQKAALEEALKQKRGEFTSKLEAERAKLKQESGEILSKAIPSWSDDTRGQLEKYLIAQGYPEHVVPHLNPMDYQLAWKASQFDKIKAEAATTVKKAATPTITPSSRREMPKAVQDKLNYRKKLAKTSDPKARSRLAEDAIADIFSR